MFQEKWAGEFAEQSRPCQMLTYRTSIAERQKVRHPQDIRQAFLNGI